MSLPADHSERAKREDITYARFRCLECKTPWTIAIFEGEIPEGADVCRCGANGRLEGRS